MHLFHSIYELHNIWHIHLYLYISKSWSVAFIVVMFQLSHISIHVIIILLFNFPIIFFLTFTHFLKNIYTFFNIFISLTFSSPHYPLPYFFISPLPSTLISLFVFLFIFLSFFVLSYSQPFTINLSLSSIFYILFPHKKKKVLFLSLSIFLVDFYFLFFLHLCFRLINCCVL